MGNALTVGHFIAAVVVLLAWGLYELRVQDHLVNLRSASRRQVLLTNLSAINVGLAFLAVTLVLPKLIALADIHRVQNGSVHGRRRNLWGPDGTFDDCGRTARGTPVNCRRRVDV